MRAIIKKKNWLNLNLNSHFYLNCTYQHIFFKHHDTIKIKITYNLCNNLLNIY